MFLFCFTVFSYFYKRRHAFTQGNRKGNGDRERQKKWIECEGRYGRWVAEAKGKTTRVTKQSIKADVSIKHSAQKTNTERESTQHNLPTHNIGSLFTYVSPFPFSFLFSKNTINNNYHHHSSSVQCIPLFNIKY